MILRTTDRQHASDETEFRKYLISELGTEDAETLASFTWENSATPVAYMTSLAHLVRGVGTHGKGYVSRVLEVARKPKEIREAEMDLAVFAHVVVNDCSRRVACSPEAERGKVAEEVWLELVHRTREKLGRMWPGSPDYIVNGALAVGCIWDKQAGTFGIEPIKLVAAMRQKDPLA